MGIYIKGMEMPKGCKDCGLKVNCDECEGWECVCMPLHTTIGYYDDLLSDKRREDCPLVPVPQHGRLIDADAFTDCLATLLQFPSNLVNGQWIVNTLREQPTIIPAEPAEEGELQKLKQAISGFYERHKAEEDET